jgi:hypothetical protein
MASKFPEQLLTNVDYPVSDSWQRVMYKKSHPARNYLEDLIEHLSLDQVKPDMTDIARALTFSGIEPEANLDELEGLLACAKWGMLIAKTSKTALAGEKGKVTALSNRIADLKNTVELWKQKYIDLKDQFRQRMESFEPVAEAMADLAFAEVNGQLWSVMQKQFSRLSKEMRILTNKAG